MHDFKLDDKVCYKADAAPFEVVGIRKTTVEIQGDWSGGTHNVNQKGWVKHTEIKPYDQTKVRYYVDGKPFTNGVALT
jgi:hypothetical protein|tara:strand:+ start:70 stop:303 length:234 start_codon:yes stop_codon:yes gene_type:complete